MGVYVRLFGGMGPCLGRSRVKPAMKRRRSLYRWHGTGTDRLLPPRGWGYGHRAWP